MHYYRTSAYLFPAVATGVKKIFPSSYLWKVIILKSVSPSCCTSVGNEKFLLYDQIWNICVLPCKQSLHINIWRKDQRINALTFCFMFWKKTAARIVAFTLYIEKKKIKIWWKYLSSTKIASAISWNSLYTDCSKLNLLPQFSLNFGFTTFTNVLYIHVNNPLGKNMW